MPNRAVNGASDSQQRLYSLFSVRKLGTGRMEYIRLSEHALPMPRAIVLFGRALRESILGKAGRMMLRPVSK